LQGSRAVKAVQNRAQDIGPSLAEAVSQTTSTLAGHIDKPRVVCDLLEEGNEVLGFGKEAAV